MRPSQPATQIAIGLVVYIRHLKRNKTENAGDKMAYILVLAPGLLRELLGVLRVIGDQDVVKQSSRFNLVVMEEETNISSSNKSFKAPTVCFT